MRPVINLNLPRISSAYWTGYRLRQRGGDPEPYVGRYNAVERLSFRGGWEGQTISATRMAIEAYVQRQQEGA